MLLARRSLLGDTAGVSIEGVVASTVAVLRRAESLFSATADSTVGGAADAVTEAAAASHAIAARTEDLGGALASAHRDVLAEAADRLDRVSDTDTALAEQIGRAGDAHADGAAAATDLRVGAQDIPARLGPWADLPAGELAGLVALRNRVVDMQRLLASHGNEASRIADTIAGLGYD